MGIFICIIVYFQIRRLQLPHIDPCRADVVVDVLCESFQVVIRILALLQTAPEILVSCFFLVNGSLVECFSFDLDVFKVILLGH